MDALVEAPVVPTRCWLERDRDTLGRDEEELPLNLFCALLFQPREDL